MNHAGHRRLRARTEVGRRASDGAGDRYSTHDWDQEVRDSLRNQFGARVMPVAAHAVSHYRREQAFESREDRHSQSRRQQRQNQIDAEDRHIY